MQAFPRKLISWVGIALAPCLCAQTREQRGEGPALSGLTDFHHTKWSGLGAVFDIKQSSEGYLWLTTSKGVFRFDGVQFQTLDEVTRGAVQQSDIDSVFLGAGGGLWLTTEGGGLLRWQDGKLLAYPDRRCTPSRKQGQLVEQDGVLWVQATAGLFRLRNSMCEQIGPEQGYPGGFPAALYADRAGTLWVKTQTGPLLALKRGDARFQQAPYGAGTSSGFAFLHEAPDGTLWLSDNQGLRRVTGAAAAAGQPAPKNRGARKTAAFGDFAFAPNGSLWAATPKGIRRFDDAGKWEAPVALESAPGEGFSPNDGLSSDAVWKVLVDREGVWIGTNSGLDLLRRTSLIAVRLPRTQEHEFSIAAGENGSVWTGNSSLPLTHIAADGTVTSIPGTRQTGALRRDHSGTIWSAGAGDANLWRSVGGRFVPLHYPDEGLDSVIFVAADRNNDPWITTSSGRAYRFAHGSWSDETATLGKKPGVRGAMVDDKDGNVWFAFSNKVAEWDGTDYHRFSFPDGQRGVSQNTMSVRGGHVWLGGAGGVQLFSNGQFHILRWKDPGPGRVSGLVETETGDLWINGFSGITHVSAPELRRWIDDPRYAVSAEHLDELDGLPGLSGEALPEPSLVEAPDGKLWFATTRGIAWLNPATYETNRNRTPPPVIISAVTSGGKTFAGADGLKLPPPADSVEIDYTALSLAIPERVLFRYRLEGVDDDWQNVGTRRQAYYTKLRPGDYQFHVIASNNDGVWNETGAALRFRVMPAYYQTAWFQGLCAVAIAGLLWTLHRLRLRQAAQQMHIRMEERVGERTRIARDLHDTILQSFQGVLLKFHAATYLLPGRPMEAKETIESAIDQARHAIAEGRDAIQGLRSSTIVADLAQAISAFGESLAGEYGTEAAPSTRVLVEGAPRNVAPVVRDEVYRIVAEALRNAFKHAQAAQIEVEIHYDPRKLRVRIRDNGKGFDPEILEKGGRVGHHGLTGMHERARLLGGQLEVWSRSDSGTEVELIVPASLAYAKPAAAASASGPA